MNLTSARAAHVIEILESRIAPAVFVWTGAFSNVWNNPANWTNFTSGNVNGFPGTQPNGIPDTAIIGDAAGSATLTLSSDVAIHQLTFNGSGTPTISGGKITFLDRAVSNVSEAPRIELTSATTATVASGIALASNLPLTLDSSGAGSSLVLNGVLSSAPTPGSFGGFIKTGASNLTLGGTASNTFPNTATGAGFKVTAGAVFFSKSAAIAMPSDLQITGGGVLISGTGEQIADTANVTMSSPGTFGLLKNETINQLSGTGGIVNGLANTQLTLLSDSSFGGSFGTNLGAVLFDIRLFGKKLDLTGRQPSNTEAKIRVVGGQLNVTGNYNYTDVTLAAGGPGDPGVLSGTGSVRDVTSTFDGRISPGTGRSDGLGDGTSIGVLTVRNLSATSTANLTVNFDLTDGGLDTIVLNGTIANQVLTKFTTTQLTAADGQVLPIYKVPGTTPLSTLSGAVPGGSTGLFDSSIVALGNSDFPLAIHYDGGTGNDVVLVAEPALYATSPTSISADGKTATFLQEDGDLLTIKTTKGKFQTTNFHYDQLQGGSGGRLSKIDISLSSYGLMFQGAKITGTVTKGANGDGFAEIGAVDATGVDLASFTLAGRLGKITAGDDNFRTAGLGSLNVLSLGSSVDFLSYTPKAASLFTSTIVGKLGSLVVSPGKRTPANTPTLPEYAGFIFQAFVQVQADDAPANFKYGGIGSVTIGSMSGSNDTGVNQTTTGPGGRVTFAPGTIRADGPIGAVTVNGTQIGGQSDYSGVIWSRTSMGNVTFTGKTISGSLTGGDGFDSGAIFVASPDDRSITGGKMGAVKIAGSLTGSGGDNSGTLYADGGIGAVTIGGDLTTGLGTATGAIITNGGIASVKIVGAVTTGPTAYSGSIVAFGGNIGAVNVGSITVGGPMGGGPVGIISGGSIKSITAASLGSLNGGLGVISAFGKITGGNAIGSVNIKGDANGWSIVAGYDPTVDLTGATGTSNPNASIGTVSVRGVFSGAITAGVIWGADSQVGVNDTRMPGDTLPRILATLGKITIGDPAPGSTFEAEKIGGLKIAGVAAKLTSGIDNLSLANGAMAIELA